MPERRMWCAVRRRAPVPILLLLFAFTACSDSTTGPGGADGANAELRLSANVSATHINLLVATVTAPDIARPLVYNIPVVEGFASATLRMPAGDGRTIVVQAFAINGDVTHEGDVTISVRPGPNPPVQIPLVPRPGNVPVTVIMGEFSVEVQPGSAQVDAGQSVQLQAVIFGTSGQVLDNVEWASTNPAIATVDANGLVIGHLEGVVEIVANYKGVAGAAVVTVGEGFGTGDQDWFVGTGSITVREGSQVITDQLWPPGFCDPSCPVEVSKTQLAGNQVSIDWYVDGEAAWEDLIVELTDNAFEAQGEVFVGESAMPCLLTVRFDFSALTSMSGFYDLQCQDEVGSIGRIRFSFSGNLMN